VPFDHPAHVPFLSFIFFGQYLGWIRW